MLQLRGSRKGCESVFGGVGNGQTVSGSFQQGMTFVFQKHHIGSIRETRSEDIRVNVGEPKRGVQGKRMSTYTNIVEVERKRSGWISVIFHR